MNTCAATSTESERKEAISYSYNYTTARVFALTWHFLDEFSEWGGDLFMILRRVFECTCPVFTLDNQHGDVPEISEVKSPSFAPPSHIAQIRIGTLTMIAE